MRTDRTRGAVDAVDEVFVQINCAASVDGKISTRERRQVRISSDEDMERVHGLRASFDGIAVGVGTVLADDPKLTSKTGRDPVRVVVDSRCRIPVDAEVLRAGDGPVIVAASKDAPAERVRGLKEAGAEVLRVGEGQTDLELLMGELSARGVESLLVEGGGGLNWGFFEAGLVHRVSVFTGGFVFGGTEAPTVVDGEGFPEEEAPELELVSAEDLGGGVLAEWRVERG